jgi:3-oxoacyl-(acyl-carrier-protein) synthase
MQSKPTALLIGLPNNVLCYGSILLNVKGPNSNYTSTFLSGHIALINAAKRIRRGQVETAVAGGFAMHSEKVNSAMFEKLGVATLDGEKASLEGLAQIADGAVFLGLTNERKEGQKSLEFIDGAVASDSTGPLKFDRYGHCFEKLINDLLASNSVSKESVGLIFANSSGDSQLDACENTVLSRVYANERVLPALGCSRKVFGNLMEAGGLIELCCISDLYDQGKLPSQMTLTEYDSDKSSFTATIDRSRPYALVLRASPWGEYSAVLVKTN